MKVIDHTNKEDKILFCDIEVGTMFYGISKPNYHRNLYLKLSDSRTHNVFDFDKETFGSAHYDEQVWPCNSVQIHVFE